MFVSYRKISAVLVLILAAIFLTFSVGAASAFPKEYLGVVALDAGHGGFDGGVVGTQTKVKESDLNIKISKLIKEELESRKYLVVMTRKDEGSVASTKRKDMQRRKEIIAQAKPDLVLSIHMNRFSDSTRRGAQVFFDDTKRGEKFATHLQNVINAHINTPLGLRAYSPLGADLFLTKCYPVPSAIIECGFLSNAADERLLCDPSHQRKIAKTVADAVASFLLAKTTT